MKTLERAFLAAALLLTFAAPQKAWAGRCNPNGICTACSNCSACRHCSGGGGTCSVCAGGGSSRRSAGGDSESSAATPSRSYSPPYDPSYRPAPSTVTPDALPPAIGPIGAPKPSPKARPVKTQEVMFDGQCVGVTDGDTIKVMHNGKAEKIRLHGIDCPEKGQPFGNNAKQFSSQAVFGKQVTILIRDRDKYGRTVGEVRLSDGSTLNKELVRNGLAWWYRQYAPGDATLQKLEQEAKAAERGLWSDCCAVPPWDWRRGKRAGSTPGTPKNTPPPPVSKAVPLPSQTSDKSTPALPFLLVGGLAATGAACIVVALRRR